MTARSSKLLDDSIDDRKSSKLNHTMNYQVGQVDENGFVCIGIEERKVRGSSELNFGRGASGGSYSDAYSDYSSSEE